jgi:phosphoglycolate phosphatase
MYVAMVSPATVRLFPGVRDLLGSLRAGPAPPLLGALSNACGAYVRTVLAANGIQEWFHTALGADEVPAAKPRPEGLLHLAALMGVPPGACVYVGDSPTDGQAATAAGMPSVGVTWGSHGVDVVTPAFTLTVHEVGDLGRHLERLTGGGGL